VQLEANVDTSSVVSSVTSSALSALKMRARMGERMMKLGAFGVSIAM
jgi:hypothetical protein